MHILYLHQYFVPPDGSGGTRSYEMARRLVAAGHRVTLVTSSAFFPPNYHCDRLVSALSIAGVQLRVIRVPYSNRLRYSQRIAAFLKFALVACWEGMRTTGVDVVFATSTPLTIAIPGMLARLRHRCPMVFEVRDLWPEVPIAMGALRNPVARMAARRLERMAYRASEKVVALSPGMRDGIVATGYAARNVVVIPNSCDVELFGGAPAGELVLPFDGAGPVITYAGTFGAVNGVEYLVELATSARCLDPEIRFLLVGDGAMREQVVAAARAHGVLGVNLWIMAPVPKRLMPDVMRATTVAVSVVVDRPELMNNSANKVFDALAAGKAVAINHEGWQADLLRKTGAGVVLSREPRMAAAALVAFVRDEGALKRAAESAVALAHGAFSRDALAAQLRGVLEGAAAGGVGEVGADNRVKRALDVCLATALALVAGPVLFAVALVVRLTLGAPVLFRQCRVGAGGRLFTLYKFRTMRAAAVGVSDEARLTRLGRLLRSLSLDELPQLWNVLRGDMSLVGPRPLLPEYLERYSPTQARRHEVKPGITGLAQVEGRNAMSWEEKFERDVWYVDNRSLALDIRILLRTMSAVVRGRGVSAPGHATMPEFLGSQESALR